MAGSACSGGLAAGLHHDRPCAGPERDPESGMAAAPCFWKIPATQQSTSLRSIDDGCNYLKSRRSPRFRKNASR